MSNNSYPVTQKTLHKYAESLFGPIRKGESVASVWVPMAGRRMWNKFVINNMDLFKDILPEYQKYLLVYIDPLDLTEESLSGYLRLMANNFLSECEKNPDCKTLKISSKISNVLTDESATYTRLLDSLREILQTSIKSGFKVVFFLGEFDELDFANQTFFNNLKSIWSSLFPNLQFVFLLRERVTREENITRWGELNEAILQNIIYLPLLTGEDFEYVMDKLAKEYLVSLTPEIKETLNGICGGHPYMLKVALRVIGKLNNDLSKEKLEKALLDYYELKSVARGVLSVRSERERDVLLAIAQGKNNLSEESDILEVMEKLGIIIKTEKGYKLFGDLFKQAILDNYSKEDTKAQNGLDIYYDAETGSISYNGENVDEKFTRQEYSILVMFLNGVNKLKSRDDIGDVLWGKESYEKYSDWAIDQIMSKIRKKLGLLGTKTRIVTVRGRGYKLVT